METTMNYNMTRTPVFKRCSGCGLEEETTTSRCTRCRSLMHSTTQIRVLGAMLVLIGGVLLLTATLTGASIYRAIHHIGTDTTWHGTPEQTEIVFSLLAVIGFAGATSGFVGLWHMMTGRLNKLLLAAAIIVGTLLFIMVKIVPRIV